jgi:hypothetical protein
MEKAQIIRKKRPPILVTVTGRYDLLEKEILFFYSAEGKGNQNII